MMKKDKGSFKLMSKKEAKEMWAKVDDPNNPYFQDWTDYYHGLYRKRHSK